MFVEKSTIEFKAKRAKSWPTCISNTINKLFDILINEFLKHLPPSHNVDHKIEAVPRPTPPFKLPYQIIKKNYNSSKLK
jgi:hypothetical protein